MSRNQLKNKEASKYLEASLFLVIESLKIILYPDPL
jgi:hypothetical protein